MYELDHLGIAVSDCEASALFYTGVLGCSIIERLHNDMLKIVYLKLGGLTLELLEYMNPAAYQRDAGVYDHLALKVSDIDFVILKLSEQGVGFEADAPRLAVNGHKIIFFRGPDGERIELVQS